MDIPNNNQHRHWKYYLFNLLLVILEEIYFASRTSTSVNSSVWSAGILLYEMLYGRTPFRGKNRQKTFSNILNKDLTFPSSIPVKSVCFDIIKTVFMSFSTCFLYYMCSFFLFKIFHGNVL